MPGPETIADDEIIFRRISVKSGWVVNGAPLAQAFRPMSHDTEGISFTRAAFHNSPASAAKGPSEAGYFVAVCRVADLRRCGIQIVASPTDEDPGHAHAPGLSYADRRSNVCEDWAAKLAKELTLSIEGPFKVRGEGE